MNKNILICFMLISLCTSLHAQETPREINTINDVKKQELIAQAWPVFRMYQQNVQSATRANVRLQDLQHFATNYFLNSHNPTVEVRIGHEIKRWDPVYYFGWLYGIYHNINQHADATSEIKIEVKRDSDGGENVKDENSNHPTVYFNFTQITINKKNGRSTANKPDTTNKTMTIVIHFDKDEYGKYHTPKIDSVKVDKM